MVAFHSFHIKISQEEQNILKLNCENPQQPEINYPLYPGL